MICPPCVIAGNKTRAVRLIPDIDKTPTLRLGVEITLRQATELHAQCTGCECHHCVPDIDQLRHVGPPSHRLP